MNKICILLIDGIYVISVMFDSVFFVYNIKSNLFVVRLSYLFLFRLIYSYSHNNIRDLYYIYELYYIYIQTWISIISIFFLIVHKDQSDYTQKIYNIQLVF